NMLAFLGCFLSQGVRTKRRFDGERRAERCCQLQVLRLTKQGPHLRIVAAHSATCMEVDAAINEREDLACKMVGYATGERTLATAGKRAVYIFPVGNLS